MSLSLAAGPWQRRGWSPFPHLRIGSSRENLIEREARAAFIDQPPVSAAVIFTALLPDGATRRQQSVKRARAPPVH